MECYFSTHTTNVPRADGLLTHFLITSYNPSRKTYDSEVKLVRGGPVCKKKKTLTLVEHEASIETIIEIFQSIVQDKEASMSSTDASTQSWHGI